MNSTTYPNQVIIGCITKNKTIDKINLQNTDILDKILKSGIMTIKENNEEYIIKSLDEYLLYFNKTHN